MGAASLPLGRRAGRGPAARVRPAACAARAPVRWRVGVRAPARHGGAPSRVLMDCTTALKLMRAAGRVEASAWRGVERMPQSRDMTSSSERRPRVSSRTARPSASATSGSSQKPGTTISSEMSCRAAHGVLPAHSKRHHLAALAAGGRPSAKSCARPLRGLRPVPAWQNPRSGSNAGTGASPVRVSTLAAAYPRRTRSATAGGRGCAGRAGWAGVVGSAPSGTSGRRAGWPAADTTLARWPSVSSSDSCMPVR